MVLDAREMQAASVQKKNNPGGLGSNLSYELKRTKFLKGVKETASGFPLSKRQPEELPEKLPERPMTLNNRVGKSTGKEHREWRGPWAAPTFGGPFSGTVAPKEPKRP